VENVGFRLLPSAIFMPRRFAGRPFAVNAKRDRGLSHNLRRLGRIRDAFAAQFPEWMAALCLCSAAISTAQEFSAAQSTFPKVKRRSGTPWTGP
jgi:hypothetical protein